MKSIFFDRLSAHFILVSSNNYYLNEEDEPRKKEIFYRSSIDGVIPSIYRCVFSSFFILCVIHIISVFFKTFIRRSMTQKPHVIQKKFKHQFHWPAQHFCVEQIPTTFYT